MKKFFQRALICVMAVAMIAALVACDSSNGKFKTIADFVNSEQMQEQLEATKSAAEAQGIKIDVTGEGDKLIYTYTFAASTDLTSAEEVLKAGLDSQKDTFKNVAASLKDAVNVSNPIVVVQYKDSDGNEIYSAEFTAD